MLARHRILLNKIISSKVLPIAQPVIRLHDDSSQINRPQGTQSNIQNETDNIETNNQIKVSGHYMSIIFKIDFLILDSYTK